MNCQKSGNMRNRQCSKLAFLFFVVGVFASGMLSGIYYESLSSSSNVDIGIRVAPEARHVVFVDDHVENLGGPRLALMPHIDQKPLENRVDFDKTFDVGENSNTNKHQDSKSAAKHGDTGDRMGNIGNKHQEADNLNMERSLDQTDEHEEHHTHISRKEFGYPLRLEPNVPPVVKSKVQANVDVHPPGMPNDANIQNQLQPQQQQHNIQRAKEETQHSNIPLSDHLHKGKPVPKPVASSLDAKSAQQVAGQNEGKNTQEKQLDKMVAKVDGKIVVSVVVCGDRTDETLVMLKSAAILTTSLLHFHIFAEDQLQDGIATRLKSWPEPFRSKISFDIHNIAFPPSENAAEWKKMFKTCATQRLFIPDLLVNTDALLYVDTDILFTRPLEYIWSFFKKFNSTQLAALTPEHEVTSIGWYNRFARHPYYGKTGLNSGVMLMNLTRMRAIGWSAKILPIYREYKTKITWGDQDLINILFHFHPELVYVYNCEWNVRPDHCMYSLNCHRIEQEGVAVIHGNRGVYHNEKQLPFKIIYEAYRDYQFGTDLNSGLIQPLKQRFTQPDVANMYCTKALQRPLISTLQKYTYHHS